jgi:hypothetical protein
MYLLLLDWKSLNFTHAVYLCISRDFQKENVKIILFYYLEWFVFVMKTPNVFCEVKTKFLNIFLRQILSSMLNSICCIQRVTSIQKPTAQKYRVIKKSVHLMITV